MSNFDIVIEFLMEQMRAAATEFAKAVDIDEEIKAVRKMNTAVDAIEAFRAYCKGVK